MARQDGTNDATARFDALDDFASAPNVANNERDTEFGNAERRLPRVVGKFPTTRSSRVKKGSRLAKRFHVGGVSLYVALFSLGFISSSALRHYSSFSLFHFHAHEAAQSDSNATSNGVAKGNDSSTSVSFAVDSFVDSPLQYNEFISDTVASNETPYAPSYNENVPYESGLDSFSSDLLNSPYATESARGFDDAQNAELDASLPTWADLAPERETTYSDENPYGTNEYERYANERTISAGYPERNGVQMRYDDESTRSTNRDELSSTPDFYDSRRYEDERRSFATEQSYPVTEPQIETTARGFQGYETRNFMGYSSQATSQSYDYANNNDYINNVNTKISANNLKRVDESDKSDYNGQRRNGEFSNARINGYSVAPNDSSFAENYQVRNASENNVALERPDVGAIPTFDNPHPERAENETSNPAYVARAYEDAKSSETSKPRRALRW